MLSAIFAAFIHALATLFIPWDIRFDILLDLLAGDLKNFNSSVTNHQSGSMLRQFTLYNFCVLLIMFILARLLRWTVLKFNWHTRMEFFRLYNHWWYLFHGYKVDEAPENGEPINFDIVFIDALVNTPDGAMIYSGYLLDYVCNGEMLERIYLSETSKRSFSSQQSGDRGTIRIFEPGALQEIEGDTISLDYSHIINLNLHFVTFSTGTDEE